MMDMLDTDGKIKEATSCNEVTEWVAACGILGLTATGKRCLEFRIRMGYGCMMTGCGRGGQW